MRSTTLKSEDLVVVALLVVALVVRPWTAPKTSKQLTIIDRRLISLALFWSAPLLFQHARFRSYTQRYFLLRKINLRALFVSG